MRTIEELIKKISKKSTEERIRRHLEILNCYEEREWFSIDIEDYVSLYIQVLEIFRKFYKENERKG